MIKTFAVDREIIWGRPCFPEEWQRKPIENLALKWHWILPSWVHDILMVYEPEEGAFISCNTGIDYMNLNLRVGDSWFASSPDNQEAAIVHEFCHAYTSIQNNAMVEFLKVKLSEQDLKVGQEILRVPMERSTESLAKFMIKNFKEKQNEQSKR